MPKFGDFGMIATGDLAGRIIRFGTRSPVNHAFVYVGGGQVAEARPSGAGYAPVEQYEKRGIVWSQIPLTDTQRSDIVKYAQKIADAKVKYSWVDIVALSLACYGIRSKALNKRIERTDRLICSQLVDLVYEKSGVHLFNDGRLHCQVTPGDLLVFTLGLDRH